MSERPIYGVVLTSGSQEKHRGGHRIEPDLEGKIRLLSAISDLQERKISRILIAGGATNYGRPLAEIYLDYARRFLRRHNFSEDQMVSVRGGVNTETDLEKTKKLLEREGFRGDIILYSSGYHFERRSIDRSKESFKLGNVNAQAAETKIQERHRLYQKVYPYLDPETGHLIDFRPLSWLILNPYHLEAMRSRNQKMDRVPQVVLNLGAYLLRR